MIFIKLKLKNCYTFKDVTLDLTYPRKLRTSTVPDECLEKNEAFNYKRVNILTGQNASGKTALGNILCIICNFLNGKVVNSDQDGNVLTLDRKFLFKDKPLSFYVEFVTPENNYFHRLYAEFDSTGLIKEEYNYIEFSKRGESYLVSSKRLKNSTANLFVYDRKNQNHGISNPGFRSVACMLDELDTTSHHVWNFTFSLFDNNSDDRLLYDDADIRLLEKILRVFDPSIKKVRELDENVISIDFKNDTSALITDGKLVEKSKTRLSTGTIESIGVAYFLHWVIRHESGIFFLDEKMAYSHTELEQAILNLIIEKLGRSAQLFYTTHNYDVLDLNLPVHSYTFLRKDNFSEIVHPEKEQTNKNDRTLLGQVKNDVFGTIPNIDLINEML